MYKVVFFVPVEHAETVKNSIFSAGAGALGQYDRCCFESPGIGQFRPMAGATPFIGAQLELERVAELRVETLCPKESLCSVIAALRLAHPYEEPAIDVFELVNLDEV